MPTGFNSAAERNKNAQLTSGYDEIARSLYADELSIVGNYELGAVIGKGSFGKVFLAHHTLTRSKVVIKQAEKATEGLAREIYHHRRLRHPHITKLYEVIHTENNVWLVLEYCPGGELYDYLLKHKRLKEPTAQRMFTQLCGAVAYIHKGGSVHRDLKLENIMLDKSDNVKLVDFGFTREYDPRKLLETWCGTYSYAAPEMIQGEKYSGEAVDVWSMGVILFALLCGELPFDDDDETKTKERIIKREYSLPDFLSEDAKSLIKSILAPPDERITLAKMLAHPFLSPYAPRQLNILSHHLAVPFATPLEKRLLERFEKVNLDTQLLMLQISEGGTGSLVGLWELSLERARKHEDQKRRKRKRRKSQDIEIIETEETYILDQGRAPVREMTPMEARFSEREFQLPRPPVLGDERPRSRGSKGSRSDRPRSRSRSPQKYTYRRPASPVKPKEREHKGFWHTIRSLMSDLGNRHGHKLTSKKSKMTIKEEGNNVGSGGKDKNALELKKSRSGESGKDEMKRRAKPHLPNISIHPPPNRLETRSPVSYADTGSPAAADDDESEGGGGSRMSRKSRPSYRRRSTSSSINSLHSHHRYSHSKTSSTSSAGSGSVSTPRHSKSSLKVVPATPPPHLLTHEGAKGLGPLWGEGIVIARRRRSPFRGPAVGFMSAAASKRKGQANKNGKWPEGAIQEEDEDEEDPDEEIVDEYEGDPDDMERRGSYDVGELDSIGRGGDIDADGRSTSAASV